MTRILAPNPARPLADARFWACACDRSWATAAILIALVLAPAGARVSLAGDFDAVPTRWLQDAQEEIRRREYDFSPLPGGVWSAPNRREGLRSLVGIDGLEIRRRVSRWEGPAFRQRVERFGRQGRLLTLKAPAVAARANHFQARHEATGSSGLAIVEWYVNEEHGLKQGFTIERRPPGESSGEPLVIDTAVGGELRPVRSLDGLSVRLVSEDGELVLRYSGLLVVDARGRRLDAWIDLEPERLLIRIRDEPAVYPIIVDPVVTSANWIFDADQADTDLGAALASVGDVNGDRFPDVAIGAPRFDSGEGDEGKVFVFYGSASGLSTTPAWTAESNQISANFGFSLAGGDFNDDGFGDVAAGADLYDNAQREEGLIFLWYGSALGLGPNGTPANADWFAESDQATARLGFSLARAGDVNGDGIHDLIAGARDHTLGAQSKDGLAAIWLGRPGGFVRGSGLGAADWIVDSDATGSQFGHIVAGAGDTNGDGYDDVLVGAPEYPGAAGGPRGRAFLFLGTRTVPEVPASWFAGNGAQSGFSVAGAGDVDGNGYADVLVGAPGHTVAAGSEGKASLYLGGPGGLSTVAAWNVFGSGEGSQLGAALAGVEDVNGDRLSDVLIGSPGFTTAAGVASVGRADLYFGAAGGVSPVLAWSECGTAFQEKFGSSMAYSGDVNLDGFADFIVASKTTPIGLKLKAYFYNGSLNLNIPLALTSLGLLPPQLPGGNPATGQVSLNKPAPSGGTVVSLQTTDAVVASVPPNVTVPQGLTVATFPIATAVVLVDTPVTITATLGAVSKQAVLTVQSSLPPNTLEMAGFTLHVSNYETYAWDAPHGDFVNASGTAQITLVCDAVPTTFAVHFDNCTIEPTGPGTGLVTGGTATYPAPSSPPPPLVLPVAGFKLLVSSLVLDPNTATATAALELPPSIAEKDAGECRPGRIDLGSFPLSPSCEFYRSLPASAYGPWTIGNLGMEIRGTGLEVDFSISQSPVPPPVLGPAWRGVLLRSGDTVPPPLGAFPPSNTGYLKGYYKFQDALILGTGFTGLLNLASRPGQIGFPFTFDSLQPLGYRISLSGGSLFIVGNNIQQGSFTDGQIRLPEQAVLNVSKNPIFVTFALLTVQLDLDLYGPVTFTNATSQEIYWGDYVSSPEKQIAYSVGPVTGGYFYLSASFKPTYYPVSGSTFVHPNFGGSMAAQLEAQGIQGVTVVSWATATLKIYTPDVPNFDDTFPFLNPIVAGGNVSATNGTASWINFAGRGVHGKIGWRETIQTRSLGPTYEDSYAGEEPKTPFATKFGDFTTPEPMAEQLELFYVDSAVFKSDIKGAVRLEGPIKADFPFKEMQFTSTAHNAGGKLDFTSPPTLDYWKVQLVKKQGFNSAGVVSVKTGQIFLTGAGIREATANNTAEERHFAQPFYLHWGEILATGQLEKLIFDFNSTGQKFDGFKFVPQHLNLSAYLPAFTGTDKPFLHAAGTLHFDFFGENYFSIASHPNPSNVGAPHFGRKIALFQSVYKGAPASDLDIAREWSDAFGHAEFSIGYDDADQDGFVGTGTMGFLYFDGALAASVVLSSERICMSVHEQTSHDFTFPPISEFGAMGRINGCACIESGQLKRVHLSAEMETQGTITLIRGATYAALEMDMTPATSEMWIHGDMFLNVGGGTADMQIVGGAHFLVDRENDFVEGDIGGKITATSFIGGATLEAEGQLTWHFGADFNNIQGRMAVSLMSVGGGVGLEGGFFVGVNTPKEKAWILAPTDARFPDFLGFLPQSLTGAFGYVSLSASFNAFILSGGFELYTGMGGFVSLEQGVTVVGQLRAYIWGEFLGGLLSASGWADLVMGFNPIPFFQGTLGLEGCVLFVCEDVSLTLRLSDDGFKILD